MEILIVEDDASTRALLSQLLTARSHRPTACCSAEEAIEVYRQTYYPLIVLDLFLPGMSGFDYCRWLRDQPDGDRPYVLVSTSSRQPSDLHAILSQGADDYLVKPFVNDLLDVRLTIAEQAIRARAARKQLEEELRQEREHLAYLASHDPLTKLANRAQFAALAEAAVAEAAASHSSGAILYVDLDNFKIVNASLGHAAGDRLLVQIAYRLRNAVRPEDTVARFGGDKFILLQAHLSLGEARLTAERIRAQVSDFVFCDSGRSFHPGVSIGVAELSGEIGAEPVMAAADTACYTAKARGRNRVEVYHPDDRELIRLRHDSERLAQIKHALKTNLFELWTQPVVEIETNRPIFHAGLPRLRTTDGEVLGPDEFLAIATRFHLAPEIDRRNIRLALRHLSTDPHLTLALGLSGPSLDDLALPDFIRKSFTASHVAPSRVTFEIGEPAIVASPAGAHAFCDRLGRDGFHFAVDDFGAGFSSFSYLSGLPIEYLKIDGAFVRDLGAEPINLGFVKVINDVARHLKIFAVAEQVESIAAVKALRKIGVRYAHGRYFDRALAQPAAA